MTDVIAACNASSITQCNLLRIFAQALTVYPLQSMENCHVTDGLTSNCTAVCRGQVLNIQ
jgi:hypothetical protein